MLRPIPTKPKRARIKKKIDSYHPDNYPRIQLASSITIRDIYQHRKDVSKLVMPATTRRIEDRCFVIENPFVQSCSSSSSSMPPAAASSSTAAASMPPAAASSSSSAAASSSSSAAASSSSSAAAAASSLSAAAAASRSWNPLSSTASLEPRALVIKMGGIITQDKQCKLVEAVNMIRETGCLAHAAKSGGKNRAQGGNSNDDNNNKKIDHHVYHFLVWSRYSEQIFVSKDTRVTKEEQKKAIENLCYTVDKVVGARPRQRLRQIDPVAAHRVSSLTAILERCGEEDWEEVPGAETQPRIKRAGLNDNGPSYDGSLRNGGMGSTLAVTFGQASTFHYDHNDSDGVYTLIVCLGENGGEWGRDEGIFQLPELGLETSVRPGDCLFFRASLLAHRVTPVPTRFNRCVLTIFTCSLVAGTLTGTRKPKTPKSKSLLEHLVDDGDDQEWLDEDEDEPDDAVADSIRDLVDAVSGWKLEQQRPLSADPEGGWRKTRIKELDEQEKEEKKRKREAERAKAARKKKWVCK